MPKVVDHDQRRAEIIAALIRIAGRTGLHTVTMRSTAIEANISLRLVQYYFNTKAELMHAALTFLEQQSHERLADRLAALSKHQTTRDFVEAFLAEALPVDEQSRIFQLTFISYATLAMTDPELAHQPFVAGPQRLERRLAKVLKQGQDVGEISPSRNCAYEAARLLAVNHGLGTSILVGQRTPAAAKAILRYHVDELFTTDN